MGEPDERPSDYRSVAAGATEHEALLAPSPHSRVVARSEGHVRPAVQELAPVEGRGVLGRVDRMPEVTERLVEKSAQGEEEPGRSRQFDLEGVVMLLCPADRGAEVLQLRVEACKPLCLRGSAQLAVGAPRELRVEACVSLENLAGLRLCLEPFGRVLADRLEHPVALVREAQQALLDERLQRVEVGAGDLLGGLERAPAGEDGQRARRRAAPPVASRS